MVPACQDLTFLLARHPKANTAFSRPIFLGGVGDGGGRQGGNIPCLGGKFREDAFEKSSRVQAGTGAKAV